MKRLNKLLALVNWEDFNVIDELVDVIFDKIYCDECPMHGKCETEAAIAQGSGDIPLDVKSCWTTLYDYITDEEMGEKPNTKPQNEDVYFVDDIAELLSVNPETVRRWIRSGDLKGTCDCKRQGYRISRTDLEDFAMNRAQRRIRNLWISKGL